MVLRLRASDRLQPRWPGLESSEAQVGKDGFQAHSLIPGRSEFFIGYWTKDLSSLMVTVGRPPVVPCFMDLSTGQLGTGTLASSERDREKERAGGRKGEVLCE